MKPAANDMTISREELHTMARALALMLGIGPQDQRDNILAAINKVKMLLLYMGTTEAIGIK